MEQPMFMTAKEVAKELQSSEAFAYKIIRQMNAELQKKGYKVVRGKVARKYFHEMYYGNVEEQK